MLSRPKGGGAGAQPATRRGTCSDVRQGTRRRQDRCGGRDGGREPPPPAPTGSAAAVPSPRRRVTLAQRRASGPWRGRAWRDSLQGCPATSPSRRARGRRFRQGEQARSGQKGRPVWAQDTKPPAAANASAGPRNLDRAWGRRCGRMMPPKVVRDRAPARGPPRHRRARCFSRRRPINTIIVLAELKAERGRPLAPSGPESPVAVWPQPLCFAWIGG